MTTLADDDPEPETVDTEHKPYITVTSGMRGWFAVHVWWNEEEGGFWEPWQTGSGSYETKEEAYPEAKTWAEAEGLEFKP